MRFLMKIILLAALALPVMAADETASEEQSVQSRVDGIVSNLLFDKELSGETSYSVRESGYVVIKFDESVEVDAYTEVVNTLRANPLIPEVSAEQGGRAVCPL